MTDLLIRIKYFELWPEADRINIMIIVQMTDYKNLFVLQEMCIRSYQNICYL